MRRRRFGRWLAAAGGFALAGCVSVDMSAPDVDVGMDGGNGGGGGTASPTTDSPPRDLVVPPVGSGPYPVGSTNIELDDGAAAPGRDLGEYQRGFRDGSTRGYVDEVLANPDDAFSFDLDVPDDPGLYGSDAGTSLPVVGFVYYPTTADNNRPDYTLGPAMTTTGRPATVPRMQPPGVGPVFADSAAPFPLLVRSYGRGGSPLGGETVASERFLASHGYVVCTLFHADLRFEQVSPSNLEEPQEFTLRPLAVSRALDELLGGNGGFDDVVDPARIGGVGSSYGGTTMAAVTGAEILPFGMLSTVTDRRMRATVGVTSYMGSPFFGLENEGTGSVFAPHMTIAGSVDELTDLDTYEAVVSAIPDERYLVVLDDQGHEFEPAAWVDTETWAYYFLEAHVRADGSALDTLAAMGSVEGGVDDSVVVP